MYTGDSSQDFVTISTEFLISGSPTNFGCTGMTKIRSDGRIYKTGIEEPQLAPQVSTSNSSVAFGGGTGNLLATTIPWTNYNGANNSFDYGETNGPPKTSPPPLDGTAPFIVDVVNAAAGWRGHCDHRHGNDRTVGVARRPTRRLRGLRREFRVIRDSLSR